MHLYLQLTLGLMGFIMCQVLRESGYHKVEEKEVLLSRLVSVALTGMYCAYLYFQVIGRPLPAPPVDTLLPHPPSPVGPSGPKLDCRCNLQRRLRSDAAPLRPGKT